MYGMDSSVQEEEESPRFFEPHPTKERRNIMCLWKANDEKLKNFLGTKIIYLQLLTTYIPNVVVQ
jgi:hypothetical protein